MSPDAKAMIAIAARISLATDALLVGLLIVHTVVETSVVFILLCMVLLSRYYLANCC